MIGFEDIEINLSKNFNQQKLHHAIIISGKKGIGKATFAKSFCEKILLTSHGDIKSDLRLIQKAQDKKTIGVDEIRNLSDFLNYTSASSQFKFIIVDAICELTNQASNSLLKSLEEPKKNIFYFLVAHNLSKIIPTILSRSLTIKVPEFSSSIFLQILRNHQLNFESMHQNFLADICDNCPALAINYGNDLIKFYQLFLNSLIKHQINDELIKKIADKNFPPIITERILLHFFSQILKKSHGININLFFDEAKVFEMMVAKFSAWQILNLSQEIMHQLASAHNANLDKKTNFINIFNRICYV